MGDSEASGEAKAIFLRPGEGRDYPMGRIRAVFKADGEEVRNRYSISEWWLEPHTQGPGAHSHAEDDVFYVIEGTMSFFIGDKWADAEKGSFVLAPAGMKHDFENRSGKPGGGAQPLLPGRLRGEYARDCGVVPGASSRRRLTPAEPAGR